MLKYVSTFLRLIVQSVSGATNGFLAYVLFGGLVSNAMRVGDTQAKTVVCVLIAAMKRKGRTAASTT